jgi:hypothetical protein
MIRVGEEGADSERLDLLAGYLRKDLLTLDVEDVTALRAGPAPPGSRGLDVAAVGALLVTVGRSAQGVGKVVAAVKAWLGRGSGVKRMVRVEIDGDVLELTHASAADQDRLISLFVQKHVGRDGG